MEKKTFEEVNDEVKKELGITGMEAVNRDREIMLIAIERYANHMYDVGFESGYNEGAQNIIDIYNP